MSNTIPKIIHQTGPSDKNKWHPIWKECQNSWKKKFPEFEHVFWDDDDLRNLVKTNYPYVLKFYDDLPYQINRVDFARFCILHSYGGIYVDLDFYCYKNFYNDLVEDLYIVESWGEWGEKIQNSLMISNKNNNFWIKCIESCIKKFSNKKFEDYIDCNEYILNVTGPKLISDLIFDGINFLPKEIFNPIIKNQFNWGNTDDESYANEKYFNALTDFNELNKINSNVVTRHYLTGKWPKENIK